MLLKILDKLMKIDSDGKDRCDSIIAKSLSTGWIYIYIFFNESTRIAQHRSQKEKVKNFG